MAFLLSLTTIFSCLTFPSAMAVQAASKPKVLIAYFGRYGNTNFSKDVDATTSASIVLDGEKKRGTTETVARMIQKDGLLLEPVNMEKYDFIRLEKGAVGGSHAPGRAFGPERNGNCGRSEKAPIDPAQTLKRAK